MEVEKKVALLAHHPLDVLDLLLIQGTMILIQISDALEAANMTFNPCYDFEGKSTMVKIESENS